MATQPRDVKLSEVDDGTSAAKARRSKNPEEAANWVSYLFFLYHNHFVAEGYKRTLDPKDLWPIHHDDDARGLKTRMLGLWKQQVDSGKYVGPAYRGHRPSLFKAVAGLIGYRIGLMALLEGSFRGLWIVSPMILEWTIEWVAQPDADQGLGWLYASLLFVVPFCGSLFSAHNFHVATRAWLQVKAALSTIIFAKSLRLSSIKKEGSSTGDTLQLMENDSEKIGQMIMGINQAWLVPIQIIAIIVLLEQTLGSATFAGLAVMLLMLPLMGCVFAKLVMMEKRRLEIAGERVKLQGEVLHGIRVVKFYAWENSFMKRMFEYRRKETNILRTMNYVRSLIVMMFLMLPLLVSLASFGTFIATDGVLTPSVVFKALALFNALRFPLIALPSSALMILTGVVSMRRVQSYLVQEELKPTTKCPGQDNQRPAMVVDGYYAWDSGVPQGDATLKAINFKAEAAKITAVVGSVGAGKSSLLSCLLGEMYCRGGTAHIDADKIGFVSQTAWIQNMSVRENILFGNKYDKHWYQTVIDACALKDDLAILPQGDTTMIGDRGINLSGGQKQRVALARAIYGRPDVLLFDDPLSAVDANVGQHIFDKCISGEVAHTATRILVTNQLHFLSRVDYIYVMNDGRITEEGTYEQLMAAGLDFASLVETHVTGDHGGDDDDEVIDVDAAGGASTTVVDVGEGGLRSRSGSIEGMERSRTVSRARAKSRSRGSSGNARIRTRSQIAKEAGDIVQEEERERGSVALAVYWYHFKAMGGCIMLFLMTLCVVVTQLAIVSSDYWLAYWTQREVPFTSGPSNEDDSWYMQWYTVTIAVAAFSLLMRGVVFAIGSYKASVNHHVGLVDGIMHAPSTFFDGTPVGRVLSRCLKDTDSVDTMLPNLLENTWTVAAMIIGNLVAVTFATPLFVIPLFIILFLLYAVQRYYKPTALSLQRIESVSRSPVFSHFTETLIGAPIIRAMREQRRFMQQNMTRVNQNIQAFFLMRLTFRWAVLRIEILNAFSSFFAALFVVLAKDTIEPAFAGAALNFAISSGGVIGFSIILATEMEVRMNAVERIRHYSKNLDREPAWELESTRNCPQPPPEWPTKGEVKFNRVVMKYREGLEPALNHFSATINPKEKIGVAGRTGSGKSTLMLTLFRMYELAGGEISIDGFDISQIGLHRLRSNIAIIPQDPVLFSGTVRNNLDPFDEHDEDELWAVLERCQLKRKIQAKEGGLQAVVEEYGENFSQGEAQLLCMGRALLRKPKILVMDEATSSVDVETDRILQDMIRTSFADSTVLAIAHRLNTIMDSDRVIVLDKGKRCEFDTVPNLLAIEGGVFASMAAAHGTADTVATGTGAGAGAGSGAGTAGAGAVTRGEVEAKADDE